jgi:hypothetical protein
MTYSGKSVAEAPAKKANPNKALAEAKKPNGLSAPGSPYPDGG